MMKIDEKKVEREEEEEEEDLLQLVDNGDESVTADIMSNNSTSWNLQCLQGLQCKLSAHQELEKQLELTRDANLT